MDNNTQEGQKMLKKIKNKYAYRRDLISIIVEIVMVLIVFVFLLFTVRSAFIIITNDESMAHKAMQAHGYSNIQITSREWFAIAYRGCGALNAVRFSVKATDHEGKDVRAYVCYGWPFPTTIVIEK